MAKVIESTIQSNSIASPQYNILQVSLLGAVLGSTYWALFMLIDRFTNSASVPGDVATIIVATAGIIALVYFRVAQPLIIASGAALSLWGLTYLTSGLSVGETFVWSVVLYGLAYTLFFWMTRYTKVLPVVIFAALVVIIARLAASL